MSLSCLKKESTSTSIYFTNFLELKNKYETAGWKLQYTDGSKLDTGQTAYAIVDDLGNTLQFKSLPDYASVFTAEACAILSALRSAPSKTLICSDSLSVLKAITNPKCNTWHTVDSIRNILIQNELLKILWIPGHVGIYGNEAADHTAKYACLAPTILEPSKERCDMTRFIKHCLNQDKEIKWLQYRHHHYTDINTHWKAPIYPTGTSKYKIRVFSRLRLGHTICTHQYILRNETNNTCICNEPLTIRHILYNCPAFNQYRIHLFNLNNPINILKDPSIDNINAIYKFIKLTKLTI